MNCPHCSAPLPEGASFCASCGRSPVTGEGAVSTEARTPPGGGRSARMTREQTDQLAVRLQDALGEGYKVERPLGSGGFAVVYLVRDLTLKRQVAVKVLSPDLIQSHTVLERFRREAETVAQLSHPHIVPLYFVGQKDDLVYLAMECVTGGTLADRLEREGKLAVDEVARIVREVAEALAHAHKRGVIHRDIKPQNVLLDPETGRCLVTDFGIARTAEGGSLTASGMLVGTAAYLSPEQITGAHADHRSDLYALGVMAYEMLAGEPPFTGPTPTAVLMKRLASPPVPLEKLRPEVPRVLREVVEACLAQDPAERFQSGGEIARALGGQTPVSGGHATAEVTLGNRRRKRRRSRLAGVAVAAVVVAAAAGGYALLRRPAAPPLMVLPVDSGMVVIPAGTYSIGSDTGPSLSRPAHRVTLDAFGIDRREVTVAQYAAYAAATRAPLPWTTKPAADLPVTGVLWAEAMNYCVWKHPPQGRLPTEAEWEAAARGAAGRAYPWGDRWNPAAANTRSSRRAAAAPVGSFPYGATPEGVQDLIGNVWEWTRTPMGAYPGGTPVPQYSQYYVIRGGAYNTPDETASAIYRGFVPPAASRADLQFTGFRCAMPLRGAVRSSAR
jgi:formylglycine-generating enzyme required for sulfatase activity/tRNA A-37 threonylcarbamoyl transferase component Bud32